MKFFLASLFLFVTAACGAHAADLAVSIVDAGGKPVSDAVVTYTPDGGAVITAADRSAKFVMSQKDIQFHPFVLAIPQGATVNFPNYDRVNHHVYSFSAVLPFQFPLYSRGKSHSQTFTKTGTEALGCNIHDTMSAYIRVVATPYYATSDATGRIVLKNLPQGHGRLAVWHPLMDAPGQEVARAITISAANPPQAFTVSVRARMTMNMPAGHQ
ncbi:hypothetical protein [Asticcacaulis sp. EMRT-3]|uniref:hypothetical protein n=1 Tax=Asticcacaulis sp. EMRT-3 TaxID=3040349 RepID=UPI0024AF8DC1|nr:hypothetical protein [Asticcacaulis sp. EMRT-3]MDI7776204.1 hypothetical protein [Asticcacaulis sp. EMRT-3]